ncbi:nitrous oxide reductase accessory protein NosL [uncultured Cohaesibacter sp.]|uniref:nitrous oxide reductase accessory protein NosL n=1 Tax=uncultured Cohaesibacter sp. TaxID=1002546 RepID=UPI0029C729C2|nr:nitrous oxide reductase accessory protein NosL [uncultured Cohaesibacter sp.]
MARCLSIEAPSRRTVLLLGLALPIVGACHHAAHASGQDNEPFGVPLPHDRDACPVCGMFPARYPDWIATVLYQDGHADHFDGAKDLFKYLLDMKTYASGRKAEDILRIGVTDYYATTRIDARTALYVIGSDVLGPMGHELVPHPDQFDADEFMKDHKGMRLLRYDEVTMELLKGLDRGEFILE